MSSTTCSPDLNKGENSSATNVPALNNDPDDPEKLLNEWLGELKTIIGVSW